MILLFCQSSEDDKTLTGVIGNIEESNILIIILYIVFLVKLKQEVPHFMRVKICI